MSTTTDDCKFCKTSFGDLCAHNQSTQGPAIPPLNLPIAEMMDIEDLPRIPIPFPPQITKENALTIRYDDEDGGSLALQWGDSADDAIDVDWAQGECQMTQERMWAIMNDLHRRIAWRDFLDDDESMPDVGQERSHIIRDDTSEQGGHGDYQVTRPRLGLVDDSSDDDEDSLPSLMDDTITQDDITGAEQLVTLLSYIDENEKPGE